MAEENTGGQERTEQPTPKRLQEARERGQVPRSRELSTVSVLLVAAGSLIVLGPQLVAELMHLMRRSLALPAGYFEAELPLWTLLRAALLEGVGAMLPLLALVAVIALVAPMALSGWVFSPRLLGFRWEKLDPIKGLKRVFGWQGLMEMTKALAKFLIVTVVAVGWLWYVLDAILTLNDKPLEPGLSDLGGLLGWGLVALCAALIVVAAIDVPFQIWHHARGLRMSRQEVKEELKQAEGRPEVRARLRELQQQVSRRRMMEAVPSADVVITNPQHYAVALRYVPGETRAPRLVAKGPDRAALRIQEIARSHGVPLVRAPALARAVYHSTRLEQEIPAGLYVAVAKVLAYIYELRRRPGPDRRPPTPQDLPIPDELRHNED
jgi:flagellar biosynthetic protein FlhB